MTKVNIKDIKLTDDTVRNIIIMAPLLDEKSQNRVFGMMFGMIQDMDIRTEKAG